MLRILTPPSAFYPLGSFPVLISVSGCVDPKVLMRLEGLGKLKISNYLIGNRTRDLPACSIVPQPTTLPRAPWNDVRYEYKINEWKELSKTIGPAFKLAFLTRWTELSTEERNGERPTEVFNLMECNHLNLNLVCVFFLWRYSPHLGLGLPPWNSPFNFGLLDLRHSVGLLGRVISSSQGVYLYTNTEKRTSNIHALSEIRTHDPGFRASEDSACLSV
jgi:hypothetical protein